MIDLRLGAVTDTVIVTNRPLTIRQLPCGWGLGESRMSGARPRICQILLVVLVGWEARIRYWICAGLAQLAEARHKRIEIE